MSSGSRFRLVEVLVLVIVFNLSLILHSDFRTGSSWENNTIFPSWSTCIYVYINAAVLSNVTNLCVPCVKYTKAKHGEQYIRWHKLYICCLPVVTTGSHFFNLWSCLYLLSFLTSKSYILHLLPVLARKIMHCEAGFRLQLQKTCSVKQILHTPSVPQCDVLFPILVTQNNGMWQIFARLTTTWQPFLTPITTWNTVFENQNTKTYRTDWIKWTNIRKCSCKMALGDSFGLGAPCNPLPV